MPNGNGWHRGDRVLHRPTGQRGIVEGWKEGKLLIYWGTNNQTEARDWKDDDECQWEPRPVEVIHKDGSTEIILLSQPSESSTSLT